MLEEAKAEDMVDYSGLCSRGHSSPCVAATPLWLVVTHIYSLVPSAPRESTQDPPPLFCHMGTLPARLLPTCSGTIGSDAHAKL